MQNLEFGLSNSLKIADKQFDSNVIMAPMAGITDTVFRQIIRKYSKSIILYTEMISSEGLRANRHHAVCDFDEDERPLFFQLSGHKPELMAESAQKLENDADVIDINMGCPVGKIVKNTDGARLMTDLKLASAIISKVKNSVSIPVTVKCRLGWDSESKNYIEFAKMAEDSGADALLVHGRTRSQLYAGKADWESIAEVKNAVKIPVIANGDIVSVKSAIECLKITGCDGIAIGRGALGNPYLLYQIEHYLKTGILLPNLTLKEIIEIALEHTRLEMDYRGEENGIRFMRKFFAWYITGVKGAREARTRLVRVSTYEELLSIFNEMSNRMLIHANG